MKKIMALVFFSSLVIYANNGHKKKLETIRKQSVKKRLAYLKSMHPDISKNLILYQISPKFGKDEDREILTQLGLLKMITSLKSKL